MRLLIFIIFGISISSYSANGILTNRAKHFEKQLRLQHLPYGLIMATRTKANGEISYWQGSEGPIRTGLYLAAQSLHYSQEPSDKLLHEIEATVIALDQLTTISGINGLLCRDILPGQPPNYKYYPSPIKSGWCFRPEPSRDQITGLLFGMALCIKYVNNEQLNKQCQKTIIRLANFTKQPKDGLSWKIIRPFHKKDKRITPMTKMMIAGLALYACGDKSYQKDYQDALEEVSQPGPIMRYLHATHRYSEYFANNLHMMRLYAIHLFETRAPWQRLIQQQILSVYKRTKDHRNAWFTYLTFDALGPLQRQEVVRKNLDVDTLRQAEKSLLQLNTTKLHGHFTTPKIPVNEVIYPSYYLVKKAKEIAKGSSPPKRTASEALPITERNGAGFIWQKNPYIIPQNKKTPATIIRYSGVDFICAYWLGRKTGLLTKED